MEETQASTEAKTPVTVADLDALVKKMFDLSDKIDARNAETTLMNKELASLQAKAALYLKELGRDNYPTPHGTISIIHKWRVNLPQTDEDKAALFAHLKERGIDMKYLTVNSNSLNSLFMTDWEEARESGRGMEFKMPGVGEPKLFETVGMRGKR